MYAPVPQLGLKPSPVRGNSPSTLALASTSPRPYGHGSLCMARGAAAQSQPGPEKLGCAFQGSSAGQAVGAGGELHSAAGSMAVPNLQLPNVRPQSQVEPPSQATSSPRGATLQVGLSPPMTEQPPPQGYQQRNPQVASQSQQPALVESRQMPGTPTLQAQLPSPTIQRQLSHQRLLLGAPAESRVIRQSSMIETSALKQRSSQSPAVEPSLQQSRSRPSMQAGVRHFSPECLERKRPHAGNASGVPLSGVVSAERPTSLLAPTLVPTGTQTRSRTPPGLPGQSLGPGRPTKASGTPTPPLSPDFGCFQGDPKFDTSTAGSQHAVAPVVSVKEVGSTHSSPDAVIKTPRTSFHSSGTHRAGEALLRGVLESPVVSTESGQRSHVAREGGDYLLRPRAPESLMKKTPCQGEPNPQADVANAPAFGDEAGGRIELKRKVRQLEASNEALQRRGSELEAEVQRLTQENSELERRLTSDGKEFLEVIQSLESDMTRLSQEKEALMHDRKPLEERIAEQGREFQLKLAILEQDRDDKLQVMTEEGQELHDRVEKLHRAKEALSLDLAKANARADVVMATSPAQPGENASGEALRAVLGEREALKDEVTNKEGQLALLRTQMEITSRKLRLTDMENAMLKSELEVLRQTTADCEAGGSRDASTTASGPSF